MIEAAIFDIDGTLVDSVEAHAKAWAAGFRDYGVEVSLEDVRRQIGKGADHLLPVFLDKRQLAMIGKAVNQRQAEVFNSQFLAGIRPFPGVRTLFERLRAAGVKCVLASSGKPEDVSTSQAIAKITDLVDAVATSQDADASKPSPDIVEAALGRIAPTSPARCVFIGDAPYDAEAATRAGVTTIGVLSGGFEEAELRRAGCRTVYRDIADLLAHYDAVIHQPDMGDDYGRQ